MIANDVNGCAVHLVCSPMGRRPSSDYKASFTRAYFEDELLDPVDIQALIYTSRVAKLW